MKLINNDYDIFKILENVGLDFFDPLKPIVIDFFDDDYWYLFLFSPHGNYKGCQLYIIDNTMRSTEIENLLLPSILKLPDDHWIDQIKNLALLIIEKRIEEENLKIRFFDAH